MNDQAISFLRRRILVRHHPSAFLLGAQLLSLLLYAVYDGMHTGRALLGAFSVIVLALAVWVVSRSPATNWIAGVIAIPAFLLSLLSALVVDAEGRAVFLHGRQSDRLHDGGSSGDHGRIVRRRRYLHADRLGIRVRISGLPSMVPGQLRRRGPSGRAADLYRAPLSELHQSFSSRPRRCPADKFACTRPGDARTIR